MSLIYGFHINISKSYDLIVVFFYKLPALLKQSGFMLQMLHGCVI